MRIISEIDDQCSDVLSRGSAYEFGSEFPGLMEKYCSRLFGKSVFQFKLK
jgi:hypothetical protein